MHESHIALFQGKNIRRIVYQDQWWFSVIDVVGVLSGSDRPRKYWNDLKTKIVNEGYIELSDNIGRLKLEAEDGKYRETDCANTETLFRIIQAIPSPKAEPFKRWLARIGYERVQEIEDPELGTKRTRELYKAKGYTDAWIEKRMREMLVVSLNRSLERKFQLLPTTFLNPKKANYLSLSLNRYFHIE